MTNGSNSGQKILLGDLVPDTIRNYRERNKHNIQPAIGKMRMSYAKPMHCKAVLNQMEPVYAGSTIRQANICMGTFIMRPASSVFVCTLFGIPMPPGPLRVGCSLKCYSSYSVTPALRLLWTAMFMSPTIHCDLPFGSLNRHTPKLNDKME